MRGIAVTGRTGQRLVFYSGGQARRNGALHAHLVRLARGPGRRRPLRMAYVPFTREGAGPFFERFRRRFRPHGAEHFDFVPADDPDLLCTASGRRRAIGALARSDVVYLAGGNTFEFLHHLRRARLLGVLRERARAGGVIAGLSAGAILMTPDVGLAGEPRFDRDENDVGLPTHEHKALGLVGFHFFPHYRNSKRYRDALIGFARRRHAQVYACSDGSGVVVEPGRVSFHGDVWLIDGRRAQKVGG